ncbi:MAG: hypothetical protein IPL16_10510 [Ignavibacteria bacterium]|nr:hypothetical protein [Ignavibacteria bacterium]
MEEDTKYKSITRHIKLSSCHPRQADRLGSSNEKWGQLHDNWTKETNANK